MEDAAISLATMLAKCIVHPLWRQIKYLHFYNSNIQKLQDKVYELENEKTELTQRVESAKKNDERIRNDVSSWLLKVENVTKEADEVLKCVSGSETLCLFNRCQNLKSRYILSRRATKKSIEADKLKLEGTFERVSYRRPSVQVMVTTSHEGLETMSSTKKKIKEALKDKDIRIIGICGMPGVGKTTLTKEILCDGEVRKLFDDVAFAVVSNDPDTKKIQDQLAEMLGLKFDENTISGRAGRLRHRLESKDRNSILVILDDVWKEINLEDIGIPSPHDRLKIMFTTRIKDTCSELGAREKFEIKVLNKEEGWKLFKNTTGISDDETDVELMSIGKKVVDECGGLPLALVSVGKALKSNKTAHKWRDTLRQLQSSATNFEGTDNIVYKNIRLSYKYLVSNEERDLLLLCSLFAEDESILIENLVQYARGLDLFQNTETLCQTRDRGKTIVDNLKGCYLLQPGKKEDKVKLHDVIKDFCVQMAYEDKRGYLVKHAGLIEWPEHDAHESYSAISITFDELGQLPSGLKYQNVKLLRLICRKCKECNISEEFFKDMKDLRVLELKGMYIQIPSSIQLLTGLQTLCLIHCKIHSQLSMIGSLKKLEILSFYRSFGDYSPIEFTNLCNLRSLDLRFRELNCPLRPGVLSGLKKLEELCLGCIPKEGEDQRCIIEELSSLTSLHTFQISTLDPILMQILKGRCLENLDKFLILGTTSPLPGTTNQYFTRSLILEDGIDASMLLLPVFNSLIKRTYHLHIKGAKVLKNVVSELDGDGFINLKTLYLSRGDFEYLIDATNSIPNVTFRKLKSLELNNLPKLIEICNGNLPRAVIRPQLFCNLVGVEMYTCDTIRSLFPESVANSLVNLQSLSILECPMLEEVVSTDARENEVTETCKMLEFPKLKKVTLYNLSRFKSITSQSNSGVVHQTLFNQVTFPNMEELFVWDLDCIVKLLGKEMPITSLHKLENMNVSCCDKLMTIAESDSIKLLQNLFSLHVVGCGALEVLFDFEGIKVTNDDAEINILGQLKSLYLFNLPKLVHIIGAVPEGIRVFENLTSIVVKRCGILKYLFSPSMANSLVALNVLEVSDCGSIEEIIGKEVGSTSEIKIVEGMKTTIVFPNLNRLLLKNLSSIQMFCSQNYQLEFPLLEDLPIENCPKMKKLSPWPVSAPKLDISNLLGKAGGLAEEDQVCNK